MGQGWYSQGGPRLGMKERDWGMKKLGDGNAPFIRLPPAQCICHVVSRLLPQTASLEGRGGALLPSMRGLAMGNRVWVVLASSRFSPSLTFPPLSFFNLGSGQEGRASWEESTKQAKSGLLTPS